MNPPRGRPRGFDHNTVLSSALQLFWRQGYAATTVDELTEAMGLNKPSLYNAYGGKQTIYRQALGAFTAQVEREVTTALNSSASMHSALHRFFDGAIEVYSAGTPPLGCFAICTATTEAASSPEIQADLNKIIVRIDTLLEARFVAAQEANQIVRESAPLDLARLTQAVLHSLAVRSRAGDPPAVLRRLARHGIKLLCVKPT